MLRNEKVWLAWLLCWNFHYRPGNYDSWSLNRCLSVFPRLPFKYKEFVNITYFLPEATLSTFFFKCSVFRGFFFVFLRQSLDMLLRLECSTVPIHRCNHSATHTALNSCTQASSCLSLPSSWNYRHAPLGLALSASKKLFLKAKCPKTCSPSGFSSEV